MHIQKVEIRNIKSIKKFDLELESHELAGWHVLIGDNGSGKSTVLKAISLALIGALNGERLTEDWQTWLPQISAQPNSVNLKIMNLEIDPVDAEVSVPDELTISFSGNAQPPSGPLRRFFSASLHGDDTQWPEESMFDIEEKNKRYGFSAAYGPYRRFTGGDKHYDDLSKSNPKLAAHLSVFNEGVALSESIQWLQDLRFQELEARAESQTENLFLEKIRHFINQDEFLSYSVQLQKISSNGVFFTDANGNTITVQNLSDGYRSILSMSFDIIRQMQIAYQTDDLFSDDFKSIKMSGVVLIDEVDAHLHPTWQHKIGPWFRQHFPNVQFIVTTHSPLICQAAAEGGSVWKLPRPGTDETCVRVTGQELNRLLYGNILEAYSTQLFGLTETRSEEGKEKLERLAHLNVQEVFQGLTDEEKKEQEELRSTMPTASNTIEGNS